MTKESWMLTILIIILTLIFSILTYLFLTTDLMIQVKQMLQDTLKTSETNQFDSGKVYPYFLLLAITGFIYALIVSAWHYWKVYQEKHSQCVVCERKRQPTFTQIRYSCHCNKKGDGVGYCYPFFKEGQAIQFNSPTTHITINFFQKKPPHPPLPNKDNLLGNA